MVKSSRPDVVCRRCCAVLPPQRKEMRGGSGRPEVKCENEMGVCETRRGRVTEGECVTHASIHVMVTSKLQACDRLQQV